MSTKVQKQSNTFNSQLPTLGQAIQNSFSSYFQKTLQKITILLAKISSRHRNKISKSQQKRYQDLSNQQITQRSYFLFHIYEAIASLYQFYKLIKVKEARQSEFYIKKTPFKQFIQSLLMSEDELAKLSRIKKEIDSLVVDYRRKILFILYEAQVYIYQILLRIIVVKIIYDENEQYQKQKQQIQRNYFYIDFEVKESTKISLNLGKFNKMKHIFKDISCISRFYHCEISISRTECNSKPQMYSLVYLLKIKLNSSLFALILENCELKCKQKIISTFIHPFNTSIKEPEIIHSDQKIQTVEQVNEINAINPINQTSIQKIQYFESQVVLQKQEEQLINNQSNCFQLNISSEEKLSISEEELQKSNQIQEQSKKQQTLKINQITNKNQNTDKFNEDLIIKINEQKILEPKKNIDISLLDLQYKRQQYRYSKPQFVKIKPKKTHNNSYNMSLHKKSLQEKMQQIPNRFTHAQCNFKYVMNSKISKRGQQIKKFQQQSKSKQGQILPRPPKIYFTALKDDSQESFLAEQTPVHKNRTYIKSNSQKQ